MKDVKLLLEKLRISRERELEREVKIFLELKKLSDGTPKGDEQNAVATEKGANGVSMASDANSPDSYINYVRKKINSVRRKTVFEHSYYRNALNCYDHSEHYKEVIKYTPSDIQETHKSDMKKAIIHREDNHQTFYYSYLVRKYCERNFLNCVHNYFIRSLTYSFLEKNFFFNFLSANLCVLDRCIKQVEVLSVETENENLAHLLNRCRDVILGVYKELATLHGMEKQITEVQMVVDDKETHDVRSSLVKYFPFLDNRFGKSSEGGSRHDIHMKELYGVYAFIYVFSNVFYVSSLAYAKADFMELNETMLYFLSRERMAQKGGSNHMWSDILQDLNTLKNATALQSEFFAASAVKQIGGHSQVNPNVNHVTRDNPPLRPCIHQFFYIGIDFDKTIIKKDSYSAFFKILEKHYFKQSVRKGKDNLTKEDVSFFDNFSFEKMKNKPEPTTQEKVEYIHKMGHWFVLKEMEILEMLKKDQANKAEVYSKSYYYYLNQVDKVHVTYSMLLSYYDVFKDVDVDVLNKLISEHYERFELNDYFLEVFLHLLNHKMENRDSFYFDIITLNLKKQICLYTIRNNLLKVRDGEGTTLPLPPPPPRSKQGTRSQEEEGMPSQKEVGMPPHNEVGTRSQEDYYRTFKNYFHVYYSKTHTYDKNQRKYTGAFEYSRLKIKHDDYQLRRDGSTNGGRETSQGVIENVSLCSFYDKTLIKTRVCSLLSDINHKLSAFIGDSLIDLDAMLHSDIAILVGHNELLISFCEKHNIVIKPLVCAAAKIELLARRRGGLTSSSSGATGSSNGPTSSRNDGTAEVAPPTDQREEELNDLYDEKEKVIYSTESWLEIGIFFFGDL
ncbi:hypothetical protein PCYB_133610 [Plasmodium cynomolgi strain B]|uniref:Uncharacterized protein n=1 Tax=Plasmodium cynomolgi (strain B) TaxID=1120755 RepID=K6VGP5_PLACD|nr:hypothetical protein PCYB_133610 [Plasmodium cynomolgi strain B]GAB68487.1 hypothetical protein PCYB_133610 [Plasmodium cynomolgi strain B]